MKKRLWVGVALSSLDASIVAVIFPQIGTEFKRYILCIFIFRESKYLRTLI